MIEKVFPAEDGALDEAIAFLEDELSKCDCSSKAMVQLDVVLEELFINIAHYAYPDGEGNVKISIDPVDEQVIIRFTDTGSPFNPLEKEDPDVTTCAEERDIGGLGIFLTKRTVDDISYVYLDGQNILQITKKIK